MGGIVYLRQPWKIERGVHLCRGDRGMAEHFLHRAQIAGGLQHVRGERMAQHVRMHIGRNAERLRMRLQPQLQHARRHAVAALGEKQRMRIESYQRPRTASQARAPAAPARRPARCAILLPLPVTCDFLRIEIDPAGRFVTAFLDDSAHPASPVPKPAGRSNTAARTSRGCRAGSAASASRAGSGSDTTRTASSADRAFGSGLPRFGAFTPSTGFAASVVCSASQSKKPRQADSLRAIERAFKPFACSCAANLRMWKWPTAVNAGWSG